MKHLKKMTRKNLSKIVGGFASNEETLDGGNCCLAGGGGCKQCKTCSYGSHMCVTMPSCDEALRILNNIC